MRIASFLPALAFLAVSSAPAGATDLSKIDRKIGKEPAYQNKPKYCLLVFGPEAKFRVWLVRDGKVLYVDTNGNADLTELGERKQIDETPGYTPTWQIGTITDPQDKTKHTDLKVRLNGMNKEVEIAGQVPFGKGQLSLSTGRAYGYQGFVFADRPEEAPIVHFGGPLTMMVDKPPAVLVRGRIGHIERARIGTPGHGRGTFAMVESMSGVAVSSEPRVELQFTDAKGKKGLALQELGFD